jgi:hypothetical protein
MKVIGFISVLCFLSIAHLACNSNKNNREELVQIQYPRQLPDTSAIPFLPGIVSKDGFDFNAAFSPDGKSFYFSRSKNGQWDIYVSRYDDTKWAEPTIASFCNEKYSEADPCFAPDGKLYFISNQPRSKNDTRTDFDIWCIQPLKDTQWLAPENITELNSDTTEYYVSFAKNGNAYFGSARQGGFGSEDIYVSKYLNGKFQLPENLGEAINSKESDHDPCISAEEDFMIFKSENRPGGFGEADLYCTRLNKNKRWMPAVNLGGTFNTKTYEYCPYISPDLKYFFFSSEGDVKWIGYPYLREQINILCKE